jgi:hypothetical protein
MDKTRAQKIERLEQQHGLVKISLANAINKIKGGGVTSASTIEELSVANKSLAAEIDLLKVTPRILSRVDEFKQIPLTRPEQEALAKAPSPSAMTMRSSRKEI